MPTDPASAWRSVLDAAGVPYTVFAHDPAHTVAERQALPFPWETAVKTLAFTAPECPLVLAALFAGDRLDYARLAEEVGTSRSRLRPADPDVLSREGLTPGGIAPISHRPGVPCLIDSAVAAYDGPVHCGAGSADRTLRLHPGVLNGLPRARTALLRR